MDPGSFDRRTTAGFRPSRVAETDQQTLAVRLVRANVGVTLVPALGAELFDSVRLLRIERNTPARQVFALVQRPRLRSWPAAQMLRMIRMIRQAIAARR